jgi:hypothetical protein
MAKPFLNLYAIFSIPSEKKGFPTHDYRRHTLPIAAVMQEGNANFDAVPISAVQHIRRMRGGSQPHLMRCSDGNLYVIKFRNNPQHIRVLANEMLASRLARWAGLPTPHCAVVLVDERLIRANPELCIRLDQNIVACEPGMQFGSQYAVNPAKGRVWDYFPADQLHRLRNLETFAGMLALDKWLGNIDGRQVVFWTCGGDRKYNPAFIDYSFCFNGGTWSFLDAPLQGAYPENTVYEGISGWNCFEPWLSKIEALPDASAGSPNEFEELVVAILGRRHRIRKLIDDFRRSTRRPFPFWH